MKKSTFFLLIALLQLNLLGQIPTDSLVLYFPFNGNALNESGSGKNNGTVDGATLCEDRFGNADQAYYFKPGPIRIDTTDMPEILKHQFSVSLWFKPDSVYTGYWLDLFFYGVNGTNQMVGLSVRHSQTNYELNYGFYANDLRYSESGDLFNEWQHLVATYDGLNRKLYLNNELVASDTTSALNISIYKNFVIGRREFNFAGAIDDIRVYSGILNTHEINSLYLEGVCQTEFVRDTTVYYVSSNTFDGVSPVTLQGSVDTLESQLGCDSIVSHYMTFEYNPDYYTDTIIVTDTVTLTVTDTLVINANITGYDPLTFNNTIKIYPNPASDHITIDVDANSIGYKIRIVNSVGQTVFEEALSRSQYYLDLNDWTGKGIYLVQFYDPDGVLIAVRKIVLQ